MVRTNPSREGPLGPLPLSEESRHPLLTHLEELRGRLLRCFLWVALGTAVSWAFARRLLVWLLEPAGQVVFLSPVEPFVTFLKTALLGGIFLSFPLLAWEVWGFLRPAMKISERWVLTAVCPLSAVLFAVGAAFGWRFLLPAALRLLLGFGEGLMTPMLTVGHYVGFAAWLIVGCGIIFQLPILVLGLTRMGLVRPATLIRQWRLAAVAILLLAAVLTPTPDVLTQLLLAAPLSLLYMASTGLSFLVRRRATEVAG